MEDIYRLRVSRFSVSSVGIVFIFKHQLGSTRRPGLGKTPLEKADYYCLLRDILVEMAGIDSDTMRDKNLTTRAGPTPGKISSTLLANVNFERKNKPQPRLPPTHKIQKRPITHPPIASPDAGPDVQKVVYVSKNTPIMAAVKRVKKMLEQAEKRNLQREGILGNERRGGTIVAAAKTKNRTKKEVVLVKGSGRAIEQAAKVGEWFKRHAEDGDGGWVVDVRPTSVRVIDDIVEDSSAKADIMQAECDQNEDGSQREKSMVNGSEKDRIDKQRKDGGNQSRSEDSSLQDTKQVSQAAEAAPKQKTPRFKRRKRPIYDEDDVPEARTRFIHAVEIAVSLKR